MLEQELDGSLESAPQPAPQISRLGKIGIALIAVALAMGLCAWMNKVNTLREFGIEAFAFGVGIWLLSTLWAASMGRSLMIQSRTDRAAGFDPVNDHWVDRWYITALIMGLVVLLIGVGLISLANYLGV